MKLISVILFLALSLAAFAQDNNTPVPFTLGDRDRLMRNEQKIDALRTEINVRFESVDKQFESVNGRIESVNGRIDDLKDQIGFLTTLIIFVLGGMMTLIGFVIYDRRTAIKPVQHKQDKLEDILVEYSKKHPDLRDILKNAGIF
jgi:hypothetical protein